MASVRRAGYEIYFRKGFEPSFWLSSDEDELNELVQGFSGRDEIPYEKPDKKAAIKNKKKAFKKWEAASDEEKAAADSRRPFLIVYFVH